ncbi:MAG: SLC13 family permease [Prevotella sp.]|nr:SLC13 family permease [Prevotella sp.]
MYTTLTILALSALFFVNGKVRSDLVALCALTLLLVFNILIPEEALSGFSNSVVIMMIGLFVVGGAIFQTGLAKMISSKMLQLAGTSETRLFLLVMLVTAAIGAFVSNTGTVALMMPIIVSLAAGAGINVSRLLMPLAFASSMGGMMTLIGTPPNLVIQDALTHAGYKPLSFFSFLPIGIVCVTVGIIVLMPLTKYFFSGKKQKKTRKRHKSLSELVKEYQLEENLFVLEVPAGSPAVTKTAADLDVRNRYGLSILEVRREKGASHQLIKKVSQLLAGADVPLQAGDNLFVIGSRANAERLQKDFGLTTSARQQRGLDFYDIGMAELVLMPSSALINRSVKDSGLRNKYNVNVLGIKRKGEYILDNLAGVQLVSGDTVLVQGTWTNIARLTEEDNEWVVLGQPLEDAARVTLDYKAPLAAAIMLLMIVLMMFDSIPVAPVTAVIIAGLLMVLTGCFRNVEAAYKTINWESIVLIAGMMPMSLALEKTGTSAYISNGLVRLLGDYGPHALLAGIYFTTSLMTMFISNTATAVLLAPIAIQTAGMLGVSAYPFLFAVTVGASMCFASPFSTPPNALVMPVGNYTFMDYIRVGLPLQIILGIVMVLVLPLLYPF